MGSAADRTGQAAEPPYEQDRLSEQQYIDRSYQLLEAMLARAAAASADAAERAPGDWDASVAHAHLTRRVASLDVTRGPLCFGRIDEEAGSPWYIGRRHVEDRAGDPVVVDWRAPVAIPFYRATYRDPLGLRRRRRFILDGRALVDLLDEDFDDPDASRLASAAGLPDPLLAELGRSRTGTMRDIVATIAAEQDRIIRAPLDTPVIVQGGPGTGKTAVGLHRAAFLLYEHRDLLERQGLLVLGPNRLFLAYIAEVLPSLGEVAVLQTTLSGLVPAWRAGSQDSAHVAEIKGRADMAEVVARASRRVVRPAEQPIGASTRWGSVSLSAAELGELLDAALGSGGPINQRRLRWRRAVGRRVAAVLAERRLDLVLDSVEIDADLRRDRGVQAALNRLWPAQSAPALIRSLLGRPGILAAAAEGILSDDEQRALHRRAAPSLASEAWTEADLALLDEADAVLAGPPRRYGHVVVDEAQDHSAMALRMVARRSQDGRSFTILGDLAQATAPGALRSWEAAIAALGDPSGSELQHLTIGYRVPGQIMEIANRLLATAAPGLQATTSVRHTDDKPVLRLTSAAELTGTVADESADVLSHYSSVAVIASPEQQRSILDALLRRGVPTTGIGQPAQPDEVSLLQPTEAKGLEFDAVIVVEPADLLAAPGGAGLLYIALTRAVQHLRVVHTGELWFARQSDPLVTAR